MPEQLEETEATDNTANIPEQTVEFEELLLPEQPVNAAGAIVETAQPEQMPISEGAVQQAVADEEVEEIEVQLVRKPRKDRAEASKSIKRKLNFDSTPFSSSPSLPPRKKLKMSPTAFLLKIKKDQAEAKKRAILRQSEAIKDQNIQAFCDEFMEEAMLASLHEEANLVAEDEADLLGIYAHFNWLETQEDVLHALIPLFFPRYGPTFSCVAYIFGHKFEITHKLPNSYPPKSFIPSSVFKTYPYGFIGPFPASHFIILPWPPVILTTNSPSPPTETLALTLTQTDPEAIVPTAPSTAEIIPAFTPPAIDVNELDLALKISQGMDFETAKKAVKGKSVVVVEDEQPVVVEDVVEDVEMLEADTEVAVIEEQSNAEQSTQEQSEQEQLVDAQAASTDFEDNVLGVITTSIRPLQYKEVTRPARSIPSIQILPNDATLAQVVTAVQGLQAHQNTLAEYITNALHALDIRVADIKGETSRAGQEAHHTFNSIKGALDHIMHNQDVTIEALRLGTETIDKKLSSYEKEMVDVFVKVDDIEKTLMSDMLKRMAAMEKSMKEMEKSIAKPVRLLIPEMIFRRSDNDNETAEDLDAAVEDAQTIEGQPLENANPERDLQTDPSTSS